MRVLNKTTSFGITHVGKVRSQNEDYFLTDDREKIYIVSDGMGGHNAGEVASKETVEKSYDILHESFHASTKEDVKGVMEKAVLEAHNHVLKMAGENEDYKGMGCTISIACLKFGNMLHTCHAGDSRIYHIRGSSIQMIGSDHSVVAKAVQEGQMTEEEATQSRIKNQLTMAIGVDMKIVPEFVALKVRRKDKIIICSDGLWDLVSDNEICKYVNEKNDAEGICNILLEKSLNAGGIDNVTIVALII